MRCDVIDQLGFIHSKALSFVYWAVRFKENTLVYVRVSIFRHWYAGGSIRQV
ncbi:protein of unknown function [Pararobbsia alpina]